MKAYIRLCKSFFHQGLSPECLFLAGGPDGGGPEGCGQVQRVSQERVRAGRREKKSGGASRSPAWGPGKILVAAGEVAVLLACGGKVRSQEIE